MKVVVLVKASQSSEAGVMPSQQLLADMGQYNAQLVEAGIMKDGAGLHPSSKAVRVRFSGMERTVIDGPFAETKEQLGGFYLVEAKDLNEAIQIASRIPGCRMGSVEVRPVIDFSEQ